MSPWLAKTNLVRWLVSDATLLTIRPFVLLLSTGWCICNSFSIRNHLDELHYPAHIQIKMVSLISVIYSSLWLHIVTFKGDYRRGFGLDDRIYWHLIYTTPDYRQYSAIADLHTLKFTFTHALGFSVFTSRILATDLYQSHCHFKSDMKSSCHSLIPFLPFLLNLQNSNYFLTTHCSLRTSAYTISGRTPRKTPSSIIPHCFSRVYWSVAEK
jgi:hypothetical protein